MHGKDLTGISPRKTKSGADGKDAEGKALASEEPVDAASENVVPASQQALFKTLFVDYYKSLEIHLVRDHKVRQLTLYSHQYRAFDRRVKLESVQHTNTKFQLRFHRN